MKQRSAYVANVFECKISNSYFVRSGHVDQDYGGCESANSVQEEAQKQDGTGTSPLPGGPLAPQVRFDLA